MKSILQLNTKLINYLFKLTLDLLEVQCYFKSSIHLFYSSVVQVQNGHFFSDIGGTGIGIVSSVKREGFVIRDVLSLGCS